MRNMKKHSNSIFTCLFEVIVGVLLLIDPLGFTAGIITAAGIFLLIVGIVQIIKYFRTPVDEASVGQFLFKGIIALIGGTFCILRSGWITATFPVLTILYGIIVLLTGVSKVQLTVDLLRRKNNKWFFAAINAALSLVCAAIILNNPFASTAVLWMFIGIALIVEALLDIVTLILSGTQESADATPAKE